MKNVSSYQKSNYQNEKVHSFELKIGNVYKCNYHLFLIGNLKSF